MPHFNLTQYNFSVSEYVELVNNMLQPARVVISGEITSLDTRGRYTFFTLQDPNSEARLSCFAWEWRLNQYGLHLEEGMSVKVYGYGRIYAPRGSFSFEIEQVSLLGEGTLNQAYQELYRALESKGYFAPERKRLLPEEMHTIGLITSRDGDAIHDFLTRTSGAQIHVLHYNVHVEGVYAVDEIAQAITFLNANHPECQAIVITRGGGSAESLQAFNSIPVIDAIFHSQIPIITGIGHQEDETLADLVADVRASTPTHAGMLVAQKWHDYAQRLQNLQIEIHFRFSRISFLISQKLRSLENNISLIARDHYAHLFQKLAVLRTQINDTCHNHLSNYHKQLKLQGKLLYANNPELPLSRGYAILRDEHQQVIQSVNHSYTHATAQLRDGIVNLTKN